MKGDVLGIPKGGGDSGMSGWDSTTFGELGWGESGSNSCEDRPQTDSGRGSDGPPC